MRIFQHRERQARLSFKKCHMAAMRTAGFDSNGCTGNTHTGHLRIRPFVSLVQQLRPTPPRRTNRPSRLMLQQPAVPTFSFN